MGEAWARFHQSRLALGGLALVLLLTLMAAFAPWLAPYDPARQSLIEKRALPGGKYAPKLVGVSNKHIFEAMQTGPQQMPVFSDQAMTPEDKRQIIAYVRSLHEQPNYGGLSLGYIGPVSEGLFGWLIGMGALVGFAVWIGSASVRAKK